MKILKSFKILIFVAIFFQLNTCKSDDDTGKTYGPYTLGEGKDYLDFKRGSWWVYQNNRSGLYDTIILKNISIRSQTFTGKNTIIKEMFNMLTYSTTTKYEYNYYTFGPNPDAIPEQLEFVNFITLIHGKSKPGEYNGETISFYFPFDSLRRPSLGVGETSYIGIDSVLIIKSVEFKNVRKFKQTKDACWDGTTCLYYWAKDVGLVKKENTKTRESWELINFHVEKP